MGGGDWKVADKKEDDSRADGEDTWVAGEEDMEEEDDSRVDGDDTVRTFVMLLLWTLTQVIASCRKNLHVLPS